MASDDLMKWGFRKITKPGNTENRVVNSMQLPLWTNFRYVVENLSIDKTTYPPAHLWVYRDAMAVLCASAK